MATPRTDARGQIQPRTGPTSPGGAPATATGGTGSAQAQSLAALLMSPRNAAEIARALPKHISADRIGRIAMTALRSTPHLAECTPDSFMGCILQTAQLGLEVNTPLGHAYLIPRRNNKRGGIYEATLIVGYQGQIELAMRSGRIDGIFAHVVREGDVFDYELGLDPWLKHRPSDDPDREQRNITHAYAVARIKDASPVFRVLTAAQIQARMARSTAASNGPWQTDPEAMCCKTAVRALWPWIPKSPEMAQAEKIEVVQESGRSPTIAFTPEVQAAITAAGVQSPEPDDGPEDQNQTELDPVTGEVIPPHVGRPNTKPLSPAAQAESAAYAREHLGVDLGAPREPGQEG